MEIILKKKKAYKAFNIDAENRLYCKDKYYKIGEEASQNGMLKICENGIHFCWELNDIDSFYSILSEDVVIGEIEVLGDVVNDNDAKKSCTNKIRLVRLLTKEEILTISNSGTNNTGIANTGDRNTGHRNTGHWNTGHWNTGNWNTGHENTGDRNTGHRNTGHWNTGDWNTGDKNTGHWNTGHWNTGDWNTGDRNTGHRNTGHWNTGHWNTGNWNTGHWNTGDFNSCDNSSGFFCTTESSARLFNAYSDMTVSEFKESEYYSTICSASFRLNEWIYYTDEEKANDKAKELIGGYLKTYSYKEACENWWNQLSVEEKDKIQAIPNFNKDIFFEITGIVL